MLKTTDNLASQARGAMKDVKAGMKGLSGVFMHLMEEHGKVGSLLKRVKGSSDPKVREELYPTIRQELLSHEKGELAVVYPAIAEFPETAAISAQHAEEAQELEAAIAEVDAQAIRSDAWQRAFDQLVELVESHVDEEESEFFPRAQEALGSDRAEQLLPRYEAAKK